ncbi:MAG: hypothetical protein QM831_38055 [Kofleriaceae bacterium]
MGRSTGVPIETPPMGTNKVVLSRIEVADLIRPTTQMAPLFGDGTTDEPLVIEEHVPTLSGDHPIVAAKDSLQVPIVDLRASGLVPIESGPVAEVKEDSTAPLSLTQHETDAMNAIAKANEAAMSSVIVEDLSTTSMEPISTPSTEMTALDRALVSGPVDKAKKPSIDSAIEKAAADGIDAVDGGVVMNEAAPEPVDDMATDSTMRNRSAPTTLGVAPILPATTVTAPYVNDTPIAPWKPVRPPQASTQPPNRARTPSEVPDVKQSLVASGSQEIPKPPVDDKPVRDSGDQRHERTAMIALDPHSGMPRSGPWQALAAVARSLRSVRWWIRNRISTKTKQVKPL